MAVPKKRMSNSKTDSRRANHDKLTAPAIGACPSCGVPVRPHRVCKACGTYRGRQVVQATTEGTESAPAE